MVSCPRFQFYCQTCVVRTGGSKALIWNPATGQQAAIGVPATVLPSTDHVAYAAWSWAMQEGGMHQVPAWQQQAEQTLEQIKRPTNVPDASRHVQPPAKCVGPSLSARGAQAHSTPQSVRGTCDYCFEQDVFGEEVYDGHFYCMPCWDDYLAASELAPACAAAKASPALEHSVSHSEQQARDGEGGSLDPALAATLHRLVGQRPAWTPPGQPGMQPTSHGGPMAFGVMPDGSPMPPPPGCVPPPPHAKFGEAASPADAAAAKEAEKESTETSLHSPSSFEGAGRVDDRSEHRVCYL